MSASQQSSRQAKPRARSLIRTFILLRQDDSLRTPSASTLNILEQSGRVKAVTFMNNATSEHIAELLLNAFSNFVNNSNLRRLTYYKTVANTSVLSVAGSVDSMCGDTLKLLFQYRGKVYVKLSLSLSQGSDVSNRNDGASVSQTGSLRSQDEGSNEGGSGDESSSENSEQNSEGDSEESSEESEEYDESSEENEGHGNRDNEDQSDGEHEEQNSGDIEEEHSAGENQNDDDDDDLSQGITAGVIVPDLSQVGIIDRKVAKDEIDRTCEVLLCEEILREVHVGGGSSTLPIFLNLTFDEMCHQARIDGQLMILNVLKEGDTINLQHINRLLSSLGNQEWPIYYWIALAGSRSGRQVKEKYGCTDGTKLFVLSPTLESQPMLVERYYGQILKNAKFDDLIKTIKRGQNVLRSFNANWKFGERVLEETMHHQLLDSQEQEPVADERQQKPVADDRQQEPVAADNRLQKPVADDRQQKPVADDRQQDQVKERKDKNIRDARSKRVKEVAMPEHGLKVIVILESDGTRMSRRFKRGAMFQEVYDWMGSKEEVPLYFILHRSNVKNLYRHDDCIENNCVVYLTERGEQEVTSLLSTEVSFKGNFHMEGELSTTVIDNTHKEAVPNKKRRNKKDKRSTAGRKKSKNDKAV